MLHISIPGRKLVAARLMNSPLTQLETASCFLRTTGMAEENPFWFPCLFCKRVMHPFVCCVSVACISRLWITLYPPMHKNTPAHAHILTYQLAHAHTDVCAHPKWSRPCLCSSSIKSLAATKKRSPPKVRAVRDVSSSVCTTLHRCCVFILCLPATFTNSLNNH